MNKIDLILEVHNIISDLKFTDYSLNLPASVSVFMGFNKLWNL